MSYEFSAGLQAAIYGRLSGDPAVIALVGGRVHDAPVHVEDGEDYVTIGEESVRPNDTKTSRGAIHDFTVVAHSAADGFDRIKRIAGAVCASLLDAPLELAAGRLVSLRFLQARADRGAAPERRRVALRFRATIDQD